MAAIACDICGGRLTMDSSSDFALCDSCGMKHTKDRVKAMAQEVTGTVAVSNLAGIESLMKRGWLALEDSKWSGADDFFDKVLDINAEYAPAYIGKLCAELELNHENNLPEANTSDFTIGFKLFQSGDVLNAIVSYGRSGNLFGKDILTKIIKDCSCKPLKYYPNFLKALRFSEADVEYRAKIENYDQLHSEFINVGNNAIKKCLAELEQEYSFYMVIYNCDYHTRFTCLSGSCIVGTLKSGMVFKILRTGKQYKYDTYRYGLSSIDCVYDVKSGDILPGDIAVVNIEEECQRIDQERRAELERQEAEREARRKIEETERQKRWIIEAKERKVKKFRVLFILALILAIVAIFLR